jgi:hypothetical protein
MLAHIRVYLYNESINYFQDKPELIKLISEDCHVIISLNNSKYTVDPYISIEGLLEDTHKVRIILQDIEKTNYKESYLIDSKTSYK